MCLLLLLFAVSYPSRGAVPPSAVREQAGYLQTILREADRAYYNRSKSLIGDAAYDTLRAQYEELLNQYPEIATTSGIGAPVGNVSSRIKHTPPVRSLKKASNDEELERFLSNCGMEQHYWIAPKIDGLSLVLHYRKGWLVKAVTRGDGKMGIDVTVALLVSGAVPARLRHAPDILEARGELFISYTAFKVLNQRRAVKGLPLLKSPRNTASGTLRLKDLSEIARRGLQFKVFELRKADWMPSTHTEALCLLRKAGLQTVTGRTATAREALSVIAELNRRRAEFPFPTDGIVIRLDNCVAFANLGTTVRYPHGALARKYKEESVETRLLSVEWRHGKSGRLTPVASFEPVELQEITIRRASLHSLAHLRALDLRLGDWVRVIRAGGTVPEIIGVNTTRRTGEEKDIPDPLP